MASPGAPSTEGGEGGGLTSRPAQGLCSRSTCSDDGNTIPKGPGCPGPGLGSSMGFEDRGDRRARE